jgi:hypothetical protein
MTSNVVNYLNVREQERSHKASETETGRHNRVVEDLSHQQHAESVRHNKQVEYLQERNLSIQQEQLAHQHRQLQHQYAVLAETSRSNVMQEQLKAEQNRLTAAYNAGQLKVASMNAATNAGQLIVSQQALANQKKQATYQRDHERAMHQDKMYTDLEIARIGAREKEKSTLWGAFTNLIQSGVRLLK